MPILALLLLLICLPAPALAQESAPAWQVSGGLTFESDARLRGVSQSDLLPAGTADLTLSHRSGLFTAARATTASGWGSVGGAPVQLQLTGGYRGDLAGVAVSAKVTGTLFPGGSGGGFVELGASAGGFIGPLSLTASLAWAPPQQALGNWYGTPESRPGASGSNLYLATDAGLALIGTPLTLVGHIGHSAGSEGLGPELWALAPTGAYWDWRLGVDYGLGAIRFGLAWVATDIDTASPAWQQLQPAFAAGGGASPGASRAVLTISAGF